MALTPGTRLGPYEILSALGAGGMGEVYKARDTRLNRMVAIKVLPADSAADPLVRARFEREAQAIAALSHPHICTVHDVGRHASTSSAPAIDYLVMELLDGETLADRLASGSAPQTSAGRNLKSEGRSLPLADVLSIGIAIADALDKAHRAGITHRDLKPANVMLTKAGPKLLDFGLAKLQPQTPPIALSGETGATTAELGTAKGTILGTIHYMAPEQLEGRQADTRTDIWALGALLYEMASGQRPFDGESAASIIGAILKDTPPAISTRRPLTPPAIERLVSKCLAKDPDERWQSAKDLHDELTWIRDGASAVTTAPSSSGPRRRERVAWVLVAVAAVAAVALAVALFMRDPIAPPEALPVAFEISTPPTEEAASFELSPDGRQLAFVATRKGDVSRLWVRSLDQIEAKPLQGTEGATYPFWAPDGRSLGFFADRKLKRIDLSGGASLVLATAPTGRGGAWSRNGVILFGTTTSGLFQVAATGGIATPVAGVGAGISAQGPRFPIFLPDGRHFLCFVQLAGPEVRGVYFGSLDSPTLTRVVAADSAVAYAPPGYVVGTRQDQLVVWEFDSARGAVIGEPVQIATLSAADTGNPTGRGPFSVSAAGVLAHRTGTTDRRRLVLVDRAGKELGRLGPADNAAGLANPEVSPDSKRVSVNRTVQGNNDIWLVDVARGVESRFTSHPASETSAIWSPDGLRITFSTLRNGTYDLFEKLATGEGDERQLFADSQAKAPLAWSPDGGPLLYRATSAGGSGVASLWKLPLSGDRTPLPVVQSDFDAPEGQFSPDGRWLAYASAESGRFEVSVRRFPGPGETVQVSPSGGSMVRWRKDGKELYYVAADSTLMAVPVSGGTTDNEPLNVGTPAPLFHTRLATGANITGSAQYTVMPDGHFLLNVNANEVAAPPITVVLNWQALLKR